MANKIKFRNQSESYKVSYFNRAKEVRESQAGPITNREYAKTPEFELKCLEAGVKATKRQASRYRNKSGSVYNKGL